MLANDTTEPLVLADGRKIDPATGKVIVEQQVKYVEVPARSEAQELVLKARRTVADLPLPTQQMSAVGLVAFYTLYGLNSMNISLALNGKLTIEQIENIKQLDEYKEFMRTAKQALLDAEQDAVRDVIQKKSRKAAERIAELVESENEVLAFKAAQDVLDRSGHRPVDVVEHKVKVSGGLVWEVIKRDGAKDVPQVEIE